MVEKKQNNKSPSGQTPQKMDPEMMQKLIAAMQAQQQKKPAMTPKQALVARGIQTFNTKVQVVVKALDRFVNFVAKPKDNDRNAVVQAARSPILFGTYVILIFFGFGGIWAAFAPLDSAAVAIGKVISRTNKKVLTMPDNGVIKNIFVKQGDKVKEGDPIIALDDVKNKANYVAILNAYRTAIANEARLVAERDGAKEVNFPEELLKDADEEDVSKLISTQQILFTSKTELYEGTILAAEKQIEQAYKKLDAYESRKSSATQNVDTLDKRLKAARNLLEKGYTHNANLMEIESKYKETESALAEVEASIANTEQEISRLKLEIINTKNKFQGEILRELRETQGAANEKRENLYTIKSSLEHNTIVSPVDGIVNTLKVHTIGSTFGAGHTVAEISPTDDDLVIEAKVSPKNIDSVYPGLKAKIRFSAFKSRTTPIFDGTLVSLSPDVVEETHPQPGMEQSYYIARIELDMKEFEKFTKARDVELHPGMQAEVQIVTGTRTLLRYLLDPITDTMFKSFKEK